MIDSAVVRAERRAPARLGAVDRDAAQAELELGVPFEALPAPLM